MPALRLPLTVVYSDLAWPTTVLAHSEVQHAIRSFVRREGRFTDAQRRALDELWPVYGLDSNAQPTDLDNAFNRHAPRILEIGCGNGDNLLTRAKQHPENDYLGVEVYRPGVGRLLPRLHAKKLNNVRIVVDDVVTWLTHRLANDTLETIYIFFPDPWPKKRHHKRRLIQPSFVKLLYMKLQRHGRLFIATDWQDYALYILEVIESHDGFVNLAGDSRFAPRPRWRPITRYEQRGNYLGHTVYDFAVAKM